MSVSVEKNSLEETKKQSLLNSGWRRNLQPEIGTLILLIAAIIVSLNISPFFADIYFILDSTTIYIEYGIIALIMTMIILAGHIDLSVASIIALSGTVMGSIYVHLGKTNLGLAIFITLLIGLLVGFINGFLITKLELPSLIVTIGTMALYRGIAQILLGDHSATGFPEWFVGIDGKRVFGDLVPIPLLMFCILAVIIWLILKYTIYGRRIYSLGSNVVAAEYSGIPVKKITILLFMLSGFVCSATGIMMASRLLVARYDVALGGELDVLAIVLLGGVDINGGKGNVLGTVMAFFLLVVIKTGMNVANIKAEFQLTVMGIMLISAIFIPNIINKINGSINRS